MPYTLKAECPKCGNTAKGMTDIDLKFGWRIVGGEKIPQSYCRNCR